ncbi:MAG: fibronectin type III domain-containing protein [Candidatus Hydrogenedens sp.]|nr:fibronectin type III domain-containing protein [Candidatus Hydrogenedens sp.]
MSKRHNRIGTTASLLLLAVVFTGCGPKKPSADYPPPGTMRVVSVEALERPKWVANLISNGSFSNWMPGSPAGAGFSVPDPEHSRISRSDGQGGGPLMLQQWLKTENTKKATQCLHTTVDGLKPDTEYRLSVLAEVAGGVSTVFSVYEGGAAGAQTLLNPEVIVTMPGTGQLKQYSGTFRTHSGGQVLISVAGHCLSTPEAGIKWHEWLLSEAS